MGQLSLGYKPYDGRLCRPGRSLVIALASANLRREVVSGLLRLPHLSLSRRVRFTYRFTQPVLDRWLLVLLSAVSGLHPLIPGGVTLWTLRVRIWVGYAEVGRSGGWILSR